MKKMMLGMVLAMAILIAASSAHARGGPVYNKLVESFSRSQSPWQKKVGSDGYFQLRIIHDQNKGKAKSSCYWNCNRIYGSNSANANHCKAGCDYSNSIDR